MRPGKLTSLTFCGRTFSVSELDFIRQITLEFAGLGVTEISRTICELLEWKRPSGGLKNIECRQLLERLRDQGLLQLPDLLHAGPRGPRRISHSARSDTQPEIHGSAGAFEPLRLEVVRGGRSPDNALWKEYIDRYHYLGYRVPVGANLRYLVRSQQNPKAVLACLLWASPAWKMAARDEWIGWSAPQRARNLQLIVNNSRFLILPWVHVRGLASKILSRCARQMPGDWEQLYGHRPMLLETLVDAQRFQGTCYRAANWIELGQTQGRGRMDRNHEAHQRAVKRIYVYPLCRKVEQRLCEAPAQAFAKTSQHRSTL